MKCPIDGCKVRCETDTQMYQHVNKLHQGEPYTPQETLKDEVEKEAPKKKKWTKQED